MIEPIIWPLEPDTILLKDIRANEALVATPLRDEVIATDAEDITVAVDDKVVPIPPTPVITALFKYDMLEAATILMFVNEEDMVAALEVIPVESEVRLVVMVVTVFVKPADMKDNEKVTLSNAILILSPAVDTVVSTVDKLTLNV